jgi:hypothetical protein
MKRIITVIFLTVIVYLYLHNPILAFTGGTGLIKLLYIVALFFFLKNMGLTRATFRRYGKESTLFIILVFYAIIRGVLGGEFTLSYAHIILFIECFILPCVFSAYWIKNKLTAKDFIQLLLIVSSVAAVISTLCVVIPSFGSYVRFQLLYMQKDSFLAEALFRGFGISEELTSGYGYVQAFCFVLGLRYIKENKWFIFFMPLVILSVALNARTGIIIMAIGILLHFLTLKKMKMALSSVVVIFVLIGGAILFFSSLDLSEDTIGYVQDFFDEASLFAENKDVSDARTANVLFNEMIIFPRDFMEWIFGRGYSLFSAKVGNSDIGYIIQLNYGGLIYVFIWAMILLRLFVRMRRTCFDKFIPLFLFVGVLLLNVKGNTFSNGSTFRFLMLIYFVLTSQSKNFFINNKNNTVKVLSD